MNPTLKTDPAEMAEVSMRGLLSSFARLQAQNQRLTGRLVKKYGIGGSSLQTLLILHLVGDMSLGQLGALLDQTAGSVTPLIDRLEKAALAKRKPHPTDRRSIEVSLTPKGTVAVEEIWAVYRRVFDRAVPMSDVDNLARIFLDISAAIEDEAA